MEDNLKKIWERVSGILRPQVSEEAYERWFSSISLLEANDTRILLSVPNNIYQLWIEMNYMDMLKGAVLSVLGTCPKIAFDSVTSGDEEGEGEGVMDGNGGKAVRADAEGAGRGVSARRKARSEAATKSNGASRDGRSPVGYGGAGGNGDGSGGLALADAVPVRSVSGMNPRNTFKTFVVGSNNQFAHAACLAVAQSPGRTYNPLFIYGGVGLGKTHLMQAIGHHVLPRTKSTKVIYLSSENFTNDFINAIQNGTLVRFRKRYRQADVLLIDDIQFLAGKERSQEEFFHTFNTLFDGHKQIVLSSDRPASEIANLESRLVSRFEWGMTTELQPPDMETRVAILRKKAQSMNVRMPDEVMEFLAYRIKSNVRRLEGALVRVASLISLGQSSFDLETIEHLLKDILQEEAKRAVTIDQIQRRVAERFDIRLADMTSKRRPANIAFPRQIAMYLSREMTNSSLNEIGEAFGGRDHGTVIHAHKLVKSRIEDEEQTRQVVASLESQLQR